MQIHTTYVPGAIGDVAALHARYYARHWGFGLGFEAAVATDLAEFLNRATATDLILLAEDNQGIAASLFLDLHYPASGARGAKLRWFIVANRLRGQGIGRQMMTRAVAHIDTHSDGQAWLETFAGLHSARHLYEDFGFRLTVEAKGDGYGTTVLEQEFRRG
jgi:GNAT superfamily N-acetyltransferase